MKAPELVAPKGFTYDTSGWPVFVTLREGMPTDEDYARHLANMEKLLVRGELHVHVIDASAASQSRREHAKMLADWTERNRDGLKQSCLGIGLVIQNAVARFGIAAMLTLMRRPIAYAAFASRDEARAWARNLVRQGARRSA